MIVRPRRRATGVCAGRPGALAAGPAGGLVHAGASGPRRVRPGACRVQSRHPARPVGQVLHLPRSRHAAGRPAVRSRRGGQAGAADRPHGHRARRCGRQRTAARASRPPTRRCACRSGASRSTTARWRCCGAGSSRARAWQSHWSFIPPKTPAIPAVAQARLGAQPDRRLRAGAARAGRPQAVGRGRPRDLAAPRVARSHRAAADARRARRVPRGQDRRTPTRRWSIGCWPRRATASAWRFPGSRRRATPTATAIRATASGTCGAGATG